MRGRQNSAISMLGAVLVAMSAWCTGGGFAHAAGSQSSESSATLSKLGMAKGVCAILGLPERGNGESVINLANSSELLVFFQSPDADETAAVRNAAEAAGLLGQRVFVASGPWNRVHLADNLAGAVLASPAAQAVVAREEILRVLHPEGKAILGDEVVVKPSPRSTDHWSHLYHGPDNNPQSRDETARAPYLTQFLADPLFVPMPEVSVAAGGRVFRAFGHIAHKANQNAMLNTLICVNGYNGTILWTRPLKTGFMIHRSTLIATPDTLYMADDESCKLIDARTGEVQDEIVLPEGMADGPVWKWMALKDGILYALVGAQEVRPKTQPSNVPGLGHWPWGMWEGHDYKDPRTNFGFGRTFVAIDLGTKEVIWNHQEPDFIDSRGVCMNGQRIFYYCPQKFLGCLNAADGKSLWRNDDRDLLEAIGVDGKAQHYVTGYATQTFIKCDDEYIFFAGPQRSQLVVASTEDGRLLWHKEHGNLQLVLRDDGLYAAGPEQTGCKLAYDTGEVIENLPTRRACTRATGSVDSIFYRTTGGTVRVEVASNTAHHIAPMRPPCQDGVIISDGHLYWGPWMCGCQLSLYGHIGLGPAGDFSFQPPVDDSRLETGDGDIASVAAFPVAPGDWPTLGGDAQHSRASRVALPQQVEPRWTFRAKSPGRPSPPVTAGGLVFVGDESGAVRALEADSGKPRWQTYTGGAIYASPSIWNGRVFVGSADGRVYAFEAATGRRLWSFRAAPADRLIPVYGKLISTWPVSGGVVVDQGVVYAAAGIAHYDGTYVYALDAITGKVKWHNDTSGAISTKVDSGLSLQGNLYLQDGELRFIAGGAYETARFDLETGKCLNTARDVPTSQFHTAFYAYYPEYAKYTSLDYKLPDGRRLVYDASYEGSRHTPLHLLPPASDAGPANAASKRRGQGPNAVWRDSTGRVFGGFAVGSNRLVAAGQEALNQGGEPFVAAIDIADGSNAWRKRLPAPVVHGGLAVDHAGRIFVALEDGHVLGYAATTP